MRDPPSAPLMNVKPLPKSLLRSAATASAAAAKRMEEEDDVPPSMAKSIQTSSVHQPSASASGPPRYSLRRIEDPTRSVATPPPRSGLARLAGDTKDTTTKSDSSNVDKPTIVVGTGTMLQPDGTITPAGDPRSLVTFELLKSRFKIPCNLTEKHIYHLTNEAKVVATETGNIINLIDFGTGYNNRVGQSIKLLRMHVRGFWRFVQISGETPPVALFLEQPIAILLFKRVKVAFTPGNTASAWTTGTNPPSGNLNLFQALGTNVITYGVPQWSVKNPLAEQFVEELHQETFSPMNCKNGGPTEQPANNAGVAYVYGNNKHFSFDVDLHGWQSDYANPTGSNPTYPFTNAIEFSYISGVPLITTLGYRILLSFSADLVFRDLINE